LFASAFLLCGSCLGPHFSPALCVFSRFRIAPSAMPTIAVVDDDRDILDLVRTMLETEGYQVVTFCDGAAALEALRVRSPSLVILDIKMPQMDGMELLRRLRNISEIPV